MVGKHVSKAHWHSHLKKQSRGPDVVMQVQNGPCQANVSEKTRYVTVKVYDNHAFFVNANKSSVPVIVPEQSESASFVTLVEIHNVDVPAASNREALSKAF